jgi:hypothetical protein
MLSTVWTLRVAPRPWADREELRMHSYGQAHSQRCGIGRGEVEEQSGAKVRQNDRLKLEPSSFSQQLTQSTPSL